MTVTEVLSFLMQFLACHRAFSVMMVCHEGEKLFSPLGGSAEEFCVQCEEGTFMSADHHSNRTCMKCSKVYYPELEIIYRKCNSTHDTEILCKDGYYRRLAGNKHEQTSCEKCGECRLRTQNITRKCQGYTNTVCCPIGVDAILTSTGQYICLERLIRCGSGQYIRLSSQECVPCPPGTYMDLTDHLNPECFPCQTTVDNSSSAAKQNCTRVSSVALACADGYFMRRSPRGSECLPCDLCSDRRMLQECAEFSDSVCGEPAVSSKTRDVKIKLELPVISTKQQKYRHITTLIPANTSPADQEEATEIYPLALAAFVFALQILVLSLLFYMRRNQGDVEASLRRLLRQVLFAVVLVCVFVQLFVLLCTTGVIDVFGRGNKIFGYIIGVMVVVVLGSSLLLLCVYRTDTHKAADATRKSAGKKKTDARRHVHRHVSFKPEGKVHLNSTSKRLIK